MECRKSSDLLIRNQWDLLSAAEITALRGHLAVCAACRRRAEAYADAVQLLRHRFEAEAPAYMAGRIMAQIPRADSGGGLRWRFVLPLASAIVSAVMLMFSYQLWSQPSVPPVDYYVLGGRTVTEIISDHYAQYQFLVCAERGGK